jgi:hypothetical protein
VRTRVRTSCYYSPNKILIAGITYYYSENKFTSHLEQKNINGEYLKGKNIKMEIETKNKVESKK